MEIALRGLIRRPQMFSLGFFIIFFVWLLAVGLPSLVVSFRAYHAGTQSRTLLFASCGFLFLIAWTIFTDPETTGIEDALATFMLMWGTFFYLVVLATLIVKTFTKYVKALHNEA